MERMELILQKLSESLSLPKVASDLGVSHQALRSFLERHKPGFSVKDYCDRIIAQRITDAGQCETWPELASKVGVGIYKAKAMAAQVGWKPTPANAKYIGKTYGNYTVLSPSGKNADRFKCRCRCGRSAIVQRTNLGRTIGCNYCSQVKGRPVGSRNAKK